MHQSDTAPPPAEPLPRVPKPVYLSVTVLVIAVALFLAWIGLDLMAEFSDRMRDIEPPETDVAIEVRVLELQATEKEVIYESTGFLESPSTITLAAETDGKLEAIGKNEGELVEAGEEIARLENVFYSARVESARARGVGLEARAAFLRTELDRVKKLVAEGSLGVAEEDRLRSELLAIEAERTASAAAEREAELYLSRCRVSAPRAGVWFRDHAQVGEYLRTGAPIGELRVLDPLELAVEVPAEVRLSLRVGDSARVEIVDVDPALHSIPSDREGCVISELPAGARSESRRFPVIVRLPNENRDLVPGLFARARFRVGRTKTLLLVPKEIVFDRFGQRSVYVVVPDGEELRAAVRTVEVRSVADEPGFWHVEAGVSAGDRLIASPIDQLSPGAEVRSSGSP